jgi:hypothetical protein
LQLAWHLALRQLALQAVDVALAALDRCLEGGHAVQVFLVVTGFRSPLLWLTVVEILSPPKSNTATARSPSVEL